MTTILKHLKLSALFFLCFGLTIVQAQEVIPATGGNATGNGGSISYTIGQIVYFFNTGPNGSVAQGVQHPFDISVVGLNETEKISSQYSVYPNPTNNYLTLKIENFKAANLFYQLYDISGRLLDSKKLSDNETKIEVGYLTPSIYFLQIFNGNKEIQAFKIIKN
ncbi:MAG: T9SS type A sorting domain-containing protein [Bacteroidetes bacterium]|nr:T9SS type A sorting domain-containing protein [Bacteroidota bacterium]